MRLEQVERVVEARRGGFNSTQRAFIVIRVGGRKLHESRAATAPASSPSAPQRESLMQQLSPSASDTK